jgi:hypothetical protein
VEVHLKDSGVAGLPFRPDNFLQDLSAISRIGSTTAERFVASRKPT